MTTEIEQELERATRIRGFRHGLHEFWAHARGVERLKKSNDLTESHYLNKSLLDRKTKELLMIVGLVAQKSLISHIQIHMHAAYRAGASPEEIMEVLELMRLELGAVTLMGGLEAWRATFRPDLPTIDRVAELR